MKWIYSIGLLPLLVAGCSITSSLQRHGANAAVTHVETPKSETAKEYVPNYIEIKHADRPSEIYVPTESMNGEQIMAIDMPEVTVVAKSRTVPERLGKVTVDFVVTLPRELQSRCGSVVVTPVLHNEGVDKSLPELTIRGGIFYKVQQRDYWQWGKYLDIYRPDSLQAAMAFDRFVRYPYPEGVRLDSIVEQAETISYHYAQDVPTAEAGKKLLITLEGRVRGLDRSSYRLPPSDTLEYNISSMLAFADTTTRFMQTIIRKFVEVKDRNYLTFGLNDDRIVDNLGDNRRELIRIESLMNKLINQNEFYIDSIVLTASSSPEGTLRHNTALSKRRAFSLRDHLSGCFPDEGIDTLIAVRWAPEDWPELERLIGRENDLESKDTILDLCRRISDPDKRESEIRKLFPRQYAYIREKLYPQLRAVTFRYALRRIGMVEDTVYTTVPDTTYARGVELMRQRQYARALYILSDYKDRNTAITLLSLGYDDAAREILETLPRSAITEYLSAIACARLGRQAEGTEHYRRACELDKRMEFRGNLDPEITRLKIARP